MTDSKNQKIKWRSAKWWAELFGVYRDERIDQVNRTALRHAVITKVALLLGAGVYLLWQGDAWGWVVLAALAATSGYLGWQWRRWEGIKDEWSRYQFERQYLYVSNILLLIPIAFWLLPIENAIDDGVWALLFAAPIFVSLGTQFRSRAYPMRTWVLAFIVFIGGGVFGWLAGAGDLSPQIIWGVGIVYAIILAATSIYWYRQRRW